MGKHSILEKPRDCILCLLKGVLMETWSSLWIKGKRQDCKFRTQSSKMALLNIPDAH